MSSPEEIARFDGLIETFRASTAALEKDFAIGQRALLERALKAEARYEYVRKLNPRQYADLWMKPGFDDNIDAAIAQK